MAGEIPMSVRRLVATMDTSGVNVSEFCAQHNVSRDWFYMVRRRYRAEGEAALEPRSRAPMVVANKTSAAIEEQIVRIRKDLDEQGLDAGAVTIEWHLIRQGCDAVPSPSTIWRILKARGFVQEDSSKAPKRVPRSFEADRANGVWQIDGTDWELADATAVKIINVIDDGSRVCVASQVHEAESLAAAFATLLAGADQWGLPARVLSDNGRGLVALQEPLAGLGISIGHSRPYHPQTCGKVERFHQTLKKWLASQRAPETFAELQALLDTFRCIYNYERPHRSLGRDIPADRWNQMPKTGPQDRPLDLARASIGDRTVSPNGIINYEAKTFSIGNNHAGETATIISTGDNTRIFIGTKLIRHIATTPGQRQYPLHPRRGRPKKHQ